MTGVSVPDDPFEDVLGQPIETFEWVCPSASCSFRWTSKCRQADIDEALKRGVWCPTCKTTMRPPNKL